MYQFAFVVEKKEILVRTSSEVEESRSMHRSTPLFGSRVTILTGIKTHEVKCRPISRVLSLYKVRSCSRIQCRTETPFGSFIWYSPTTVPTRTEDRGRTARHGTYFILSTCHCPQGSSLIRRLYCGETHVLLLVDSWWRDRSKHWYIVYIVPAL